MRLLSPVATPNSQPRENPHCSFCDDTKLVIDPEKANDQYPNGQVVRCPKCYRPQNDTRLIARLTANNGLSKKEQTYTIEQMHVEPGNKRAIAAVKAMLEKPEPSGILYLWSTQHGIGKTHLLASAVNVCTNNGVQALYITMHKLLDYLRAGFDQEKRDEKYEARINTLCTCPLLAIDDFERFRGTSFETDQAENILTERYRTASETMTMVAGTTDPKKLPEFIASRYIPVAVQISGTSWRGRP